MRYFDKDGEKIPKMAWEKLRKKGWKYRLLRYNRVGCRDVVTTWEGQHCRIRNWCPFVVSIRVCGTVVEKSREMTRESAINYHEAQVAFLKSHGKRAAKLYIYRHGYTI